MVDQPRLAPSSVSVIVVTLAKPEFVRTCLEHLFAQSRLPDEILVVDASPDDLTYQVVMEFPTVRYFRNPFGPGTTGMSRNIGLAEASGDVVAFVDDDAFAHPAWLEQLLLPYQDMTVGGVGGRAVNGIMGEEHFGAGTIGQFLPNGTLTENFAADPGHIVEVDHFLGANMSFLRSVLVDIGGIRDGYPGTCLREETDLALRVQKAGWKLLFTPTACVDHVPAPYPQGQRFDLRYRYFAQRNHVVLLMRLRGVRSTEVRRYVKVALKEVGDDMRQAGSALKSMDVHAMEPSLRPVARKSLGALATLGGLIAGFPAGGREVARDHRS